MRFANIVNGEIKKVQHFLPQQDIVIGTEKTTIRSLFGKGRVEQCKLLGWVKCTEVTPEFDKFTQKVTNKATHELINGEVTSTLIVVELNDVEQEDFIFDEITTIRGDIRKKALNDIKEITPTILSVDEVSLVASVWDSVSDEFKAEKTDVANIVEIYNVMKADIEATNSLKTSEDIVSYNT